MEIFSKREEKAVLLTKKLIKKILKKESILELKEELIEIQKYYILFILYFLLLKLLRKRNSLNFIKQLIF